MAKNDFRVTSIFKIIKIIDFEFCGKTSTFLPKRCLFIFCIFFYLNEEELIQLACLMKYIENEISNSTSQKKQTNNKKKTEEQKHNPTSKSSFLKLLVTNYHKLLLLPLVVRP